jgi:hypothetical protein
MPRKKGIMITVTKANTHGNANNMFTSLFFFILLNPPFPIKINETAAVKVFLLVC